MATVSEFIKRKDRKKFSAPTMALPLPETLIGVEVEIDQDAHTRAVFPEDYLSISSKLTVLNGMKHYVATRSPRCMTTVDIRSLTSRMVIGTTKCGTPTLLTNHSGPWTM